MNAMIYSCCRLLAAIVLKANSVLVSASILSITLLVPKTLAAEAPSVVVSIAPLHSLTSRLMQGIAEPELLIKTSQSPHGFSLKPSQRFAVQHADLVVWVGESLETGLVRVLTDPDQVFGLDDYGHELGLLALRAEHEHTEDEDQHDDNHGDHEGEEEHDTTSVDPHFWLNPLNAIRFAEQLTERLQQLDSDHRALYQSNLQTLKADLTGLDQFMIKQLASVKSVPYLVMHDGYQYLDHRYELMFAGALSVNPEIMPGARTLQEIHKQIKAQNIHCIFSEPQITEGVIENIARRNNLQLGILDPMGVNLTPGPDLYRQLMLSNVDQLSSCLAR